MSFPRKRSTSAISDDAQIIEVGEQSAAHLEEMVSALTEAAKWKHQEENGALMRLVTVLKSILDRITDALRAESARL